MPVAAKAGGLFEGMATITPDASSAGDPNQNADGSPLPLPRSPLRLRNWAAGGNTNEPMRQERIEADYVTDPAQNATGGAIISTRDSVTFGFGLEQVDATTRTELLKRSLNYLVPTTADTTPPTIVGYKFPPANSVATPRDPVEVDVTAYDEQRRPGLGQACYANGAPVADDAGVPVPVPLHAADVGRRQHGAADRRGHRQGRQHQSTPRPLRQRRRHRRAGPVAGAGRHRRRCPARRSSARR